MQKETKILEEFPDYIIHQDGRVFSSLSNKFLKFQKRGGYHYVRMIRVKDGERKRVSISQHQLVSRAFIPNPENVPIPNHKDGNGYNNDIKNLEWVTASENSLHARKTGLTPRYSRPVIQYTKEGKFLQKHDSLKEAGIAVSCCPQFIGRVCRGDKKSAKGYIFKYETEEKKFHILEGEKWKNHPKHPRYKISTYGRIYSQIMKRFIKPANRKDGYLRVKIDGRHYYVHVLAAETFLSKPEGLIRPVVDHVDGNGDNNYLDNLEWVEFEENIRRAHKNGQNSTNRACIQYSLDGKEISRYDSVSNAAKEMKVSHTSILLACHKAKNVHTICGFIWRFEIEPLKEEELKNVKPLKRRVVQYSLKGDIIDKFESIKEASEKTGINRTSISHVCGGRQKTGGGFIWKYEGEEPKILKRAGSKKKVQQLDKDDTIIKSWESAAEAGRELKISSAHIASVCRGKRKTTGGYKWKYAC